MESDESDSVKDDGKSQSQMETSRVSRYFLYKNRTKQSVNRTQLRPILDEFQEKSKHKRVDPIESSNEALKDALGLQIVQGTQQTKSKGKSGKYFVVRSQKYPENLEIPFTDRQKVEYGLLMYCFFFIYYKGTRVTEDQLAQFMKDSVERYPEVGHSNELIVRWASMDYLKLKKVEDANSQSRCVELGQRFYAEFGEKALESMAKELVTGEASKEEAKSEEEEEEETPDKGR